MIDDRVKTVMVIIIVVALGLFILNQAFSLYYKAELLKYPCELCLEVNEDLKLCEKDSIFPSVLLPLRDLMEGFKK